jgi:hypothetical protein
MEREEILKRRDAKVIPHLKQYAPVWIVDEIIIEDKDAVQFNVIFRHNLYQWVNRRYRYDGFNDVLYQKGQTTLNEDDAVEIQEEDPYLDATVADTPNSYGG